MPPEDRHRPQVFTSLVSPLLAGESQAYSRSEKGRDSERGVP